MVPEANSRGIGVHRHEEPGRRRQGRFVVEKVCTAEEAHRFALSQPIATLVVGIDSMEVLKQDVAIARAFKPLEGAELETLLAKVKPVAGDGRHERFKSTQLFDGPYHQKQHDLVVSGTG